MVHLARTRTVATPHEPSSSPYAGANIENVRRIAGLGWLMVLPLCGLMSVFFPPTAHGVVLGWVLATVIFGSVGGTFAWLFFHEDRASWGLVLVSSYAAVALLGFIQWLAGGWPSAYGEALLPIIFLGALAYPANRFIPLFGFIALAALAPELYAPNAKEAIDVLFRLSIWGAMSTVCLILMTRIRRQRIVAARLANIDVLTQLPNRRAFDTQAARALPRGVAIGVGDLDAFKSINDGHGHIAGDQVLSAVARILHEHARAADTVYRWGGDEFAILLHGADAEEAAHVCGRLEAAVAKYVRRPDGEPVSMTIGWAVSRPGVDLIGLVADADADLLARKAARKPAWRESTSAA